MKRLERVGAADRAGIHDAGLAGRLRAPSGTSPFANVMHA